MTLDEMIQNLTEIRNEYNGDVDIRVLTAGDAELYEVDKADVDTDGRIVIITD